VKEDYICTWIYLDSPEESSEYPQVGKQSHLPEFQKTYWKCVAVFFAFSTTHNPKRRHVLFSNKDWDELPVVDGLDLKQFLKSKQVDLVTIPLRWQTPAGYFGKWRNQFYIFDILTFIEHTYDNDEAAFMVLDSDCIVNRALDGLFDALRQEGLLTLPMSYDVTQNINGVTRKDMRRIFGELDGADPGIDPVYYGGEIFAATKPVIRQINAIAPAVWENMLRRHGGGEPKLNEEAHFLSYCYHKIGRFGTLEGFIKRIWTAPHFNNAAASDLNLPIWHLPSEKTGGIALLFEYLTPAKISAGKLNSIPVSELGGYVGIPKRRHYLNWKHFLKYTWLYSQFRVV